MEPWCARSFNVPELGIPPPYPFLNNIYRFLWRDQHEQWNSSWSMELFLSLPSLPFLLSQDLSVHYGQLESTSWIQGEPNQWWHAPWSGATGKERVKDFFPIAFPVQYLSFSLGKCTILLFLISGPYYTKLLTHLSNNPENMCCSKIKMEIGIIMMNCHLSVGNCSPLYKMLPKILVPFLGLNGELAAIPC